MNKDCHRVSSRYESSEEKQDKHGLERGKSEGKDGNGIAFPDTDIKVRTGNPSLTNA